MIGLSIDVTLLDKSKFKAVTRRSGAKAVFCEIILLESTDTTYGDYIVKQGISKEDREAGVKMPILGNGKIIGRSKGTAKPAPAAEKPESNPESDDVPF